jgi:hypothetical protein
MTEKKYRIRKTIDVTISPDGDGDLRINEITEVGGGYYTTIEGLRRGGFQVDEVEPTPAEDPAGTIREFTPSGDRIVKIDGGRWMYISVSERSWVNEVGDFLLERFPQGYSKTIVVHRPEA